MKPMEHADGGTPAPLPYEPPKVESLRLSTDAAEALT